MAIHWQIKFRSLRAETLYTVNVYDNSYSGSPVQLTGATNPFETQEDDNDEIFTPVRTQSGYLRIVDTGKDNDGNDFDWRDMIPTSDTSNFVEIVDEGNNVLWGGYMQAISFSGSLYEMPQEREFPLSCMLSVTQIKDFTTSGDIMTISAIVNEIFRDVPVRKFYFQNVNIISWFTKMLASALFGDIERNISTSESVFKSSYTRYDVLVEICNFFGYVCRQVGQDIIFSMPGSPYPSFVVVDKEAINDDGTCSSYTTTQREVKNLYPSFVSTLNSEEYIRGIRKCTITADIGKDENIAEFPLQEIQDEYADADVQTVYNEGSQYCFAKLYTHANFWTFNNGKVYVTTSGNVNEANGIGGGSMNIVDWYDGDISEKHNYNFTPNFSIFSSVGVNASLIKASVVGLQCINIQYGVLAINADVTKVRFSSSGKRIEEPATDVLICQMSIGIFKGTGAAYHFEGVYWNGTSWQEQETTFRLSIKDGRVEDNRILTSDDPAYEGYGAHVDGNVRGGQFRFMLIGIESSSPSNIVHLEITRLNVSFFRNGAKDEDKNVYSDETGTDFVETFELDNIIASDNNNSYGKGILLNSDGSYCDGIVYDYFLVHPEDDYLRRIIYQKDRVRKKIEMSVDSSINIISPIEIYRFQSMYLYPISISRLWRDDTSNIIFMETYI